MQSVLRIATFRMNINMIFLVSVKLVQYLLDINYFRNNARDLSHLT